MSNNRIVTPAYRVEGNKIKHTVIFEGILALENTKAYQPINDLMESTADPEHKTLTLDLRRLESLNSSGINSLCQFLMKAVRRDGIQVLVQASSTFPWQERMLKNIRRVVPEFELEYD